jgi:hypothetical protein
MDLGPKTPSLTELLNIKGPLTALLTGPERSGKTSLLFATALEFSSRDEARVWYFCHKTKIEANLPVSVAWSASELHATHIGSEFTDTEKMDRIHMKYISDVSDLKRWSSRVQDLPAHQLPTAVFVDDLERYLTTDKLPSLDVIARSLLGTLALLCDSVEFISETHGHTCPLIVCVSESSTWFNEVRCILHARLRNNESMIRTTGPSSYVLVGSQRSTNFRFELSSGIPCFVFERHIPDV